MCDRLGRAWQQSLVGKTHFSNVRAIVCLWLEGVSSSFSWFCLLSNESHTWVVGQGGCREPPGWRFHTPLLLSSKWLQACPQPRGHFSCLALLITSTLTSLDSPASPASPWFRKPGAGGLNAGLALLGRAQGSWEGNMPCGLRSF